MAKIAFTAGGDVYDGMSMVKCDQEIAAAAAEAVAVWCLVRGEMC